ncbi:MAG: response regulator [Candidatus Cloacimonetes bacterium]|jgi:CheY-like chemotaxis protein|nr:response regulator [Candidatus Cloacimonadota bacterium]
MTIKILLVDDNEENLYLLQSLFDTNGYSTIIAKNGANALSTMQNDLPDLIISDILMPVMDGFQFCKKVMADNKLKNIPFVFYTATYTSKKDEEFALKLGADRFLIKPMDPVELIKIIQDLLKDVKKGKLKLKEPTLMNEKEHFKIYSERLVNKLEKKMLDLEKEISERKIAEEALRLKSYNLNERVKELNCLYKISQLVETRGISDEDFFQGVVDLIPAAFRYPDITVCCLLINDKEYKTEKFQNTEWNLMKDIFIDDVKSGAIEVYLLKKLPEIENGQFLKEENDLFTAIVERVGHIIERKQAEEKLKSKLEQLEMFNNITVGRELQINETRKEVNELLKQMGKKPKYKVV